MPEQTPKRIQRKRTKGWTMPPNTVYVGRPTVFGNPYEVKAWGREAALRLFKNTSAGYWNRADVPFRVEFARERVDAYVVHMEWLRLLHQTYGSGAPQDIIRAVLRGKNLACWCKEGDPCHADVLLELANALPDQTPRT